MQATTLSRAMVAPLLLVPALLGAVAFVLARLLGWQLYADGAAWPDALAMWAMGLRFDLKLLATLWLLPWCAALPLFFGPLRRRESVLRWMRRFFVVQLVVFNFLAVANFLYHGYYRTPFNPTIFGLIDDDTWVVLVTIWQDLPVLRAMAGLALLTWLQWRAWIAIERRLRQRPADAAARRVALVAAAPLLLLLLFTARGRLDAQPINREDFTVSANPAVCDLVPNAVFALYYAWKDYRTQTVLSDDPAEGLKALGYASPIAAGAALGLPAGDEAALLRALVHQAPPNPPAQAQPPHAVVVLFESWGAQALQRHGPGRDLLGRLERHLQTDYWFPHFTSSRRGTHPTLEALLINSPITPLSQGRLGQLDYLSAAARPFKEAGYRTIFMYGGSARWRSMHRAMPHLGFDEVLDLADIQQRYPEATTTDNGVHDEYLYRLAADRLAELDAAGRPALLFILNTTNHTPYVRKMMPPAYQPTAIDLTNFTDTVLPLPEVETALQGFRYASDALGGFVDAIERTPLGTRTLIAATGDHYVRNFFRLDGAADAAWMDRVGFYLRVPAAYREGAQFDAARFGSHRDIFPTLYARALSGARYFRFGEDLLGAGREAHSGAAVTDFSNVYVDGEVAINLRAPSYFRWDGQRRKLLAASDPSPLIRRAVDREKARAALQDWVIRLQATGRLKTLPPP